MICFVSVKKQSPEYYFIAWFPHTFEMFVVQIMHVKLNSNPYKSMS